MRRFKKETEKRRKKNYTPFHVQIVKVLGEEEEGFIKKVVLKEEYGKTQRGFRSIFKEHDKSCLKRGVDKK